MGTLVNAEIVKINIYDELRILLCGFNCLNLFVKTDQGMLEPSLFKVSQNMVLFHN